MEHKLKYLKFAVIAISLAASGCSVPGDNIAEDYYDGSASNYNADNDYGADNSYSWNDESNGYTDPYGEVQDLTQENSNYSSYDQAANSRNIRRMPGNQSYFYSSIGNLVHFDVDSNELNFEAKEILKNEADWLMQHHHRILIEGYTDDRGTRVYNIALGKHRASAVRNYLIGQGVPASSIKTVSYGMDRPVAVCHNESCWAKNRRARILLK